MLPEKLTLEIVTPERRVLTETVDEVVLPGRLGYLGVLPGHAPLLTALSIGELEYRQGSVKRYLAIAWGFAEVLPSRIIVLAETAERAEEIDVDRARRKKAEIEARMKSPDPYFDLDKATIATEKEVIRIHVARKSAG
ncbi:MAG: F0F1 ATP synthase subunit epsilon [Acidobacteria bacterium]|nr:MAG: F0F1 ATP synthase subunit epsilon [Acidobacteriota bacterium]